MLINKHMAAGASRLPPLFLPLLSILPLIIPLLNGSAAALPLKTDSRWIVDEGGNRVKLACVNWPAHLQPVVAEGLSKRPLDAISKSIVAMGFNCVRLTWPTYLATNDSLASLTVRQSLKKLGLLQAIAGLQANNPSIVDRSLMDAFKAVVANLGENNVMVILDNHLSEPGWCCGYKDGSGFFGDKFFNPAVWVSGLTRMATIFSGFPNVVGMSLRNELRGPNQTLNNWYRYMQMGAEAVHSANPNVLVILSGFNFDTDLSFLGRQFVSLSFTGKLVLELHWYAFSDGNAWRDGNPNQVCGSIAGNVMRRAGYLVGKGYPLFVSEFGVDQRRTNVNDNRYLNCFFGFAAEHDLDWALWVLAGSYNLREGVVDMEEFYGMLNFNWSGIRNAAFAKRISGLQTSFQGPWESQTRPHNVIFHALTGQCIKRVSMLGPLRLGPCLASEAWTYTNEKTLKIQGTYFCLQADGMGKPAKLGIFCNSPASKWVPISDSKMHLSSKLSDGTQVCLDMGGTNDATLVTVPCRCLSRDSKCDPASQWLKIVNSTRSLTWTESSFQSISKLFDFDWKELLWNSLS